jgi:hypothetical protein
MNRKAARCMQIGLVILGVHALGLPAEVIRAPHAGRRCIARAHFGERCLQIRVYAYLYTHCIDPEYKEYGYDGCATITIPPATWTQDKKKSTLKFTATLEDCGSYWEGEGPPPGPHMLEGTVMEVNLNLACKKPEKTSDKCRYTYSGMRWSPACTSKHHSRFPPAIRSCGHLSLHMFAVAAPANAEDVMHVHCGHECANCSHASPCLQVQKVAPSTSMATQIHTARLKM